MLTRLFPKSFDNRFHGHGFALWVLGALIALKLLVSINSIMNTESVAAGADGFALESYGAGAQVVLMLFASMSLGRLMLALIAITALVRYRAMVPFVYLMLLIEYVGRKMVTAPYEIERAGTADSFVFYLDTAVLIMLVLGFTFSLWPRKRSLAAAAPAGGDRP